LAGAEIIGQLLADQPPLVRTEAVGSSHSKAELTQGDVSLDVALGGRPLGLCGAVDGGK
jgi:hypothetical protein